MQASSGKLGEGFWFSSLLLDALNSQFTGLVSVSRARGNAVLFFRSGQPVHASGAGFEDYHLGQVLLDRALLQPVQLQTALEEQGRHNGTRPLLGTILVRDGLDANEIKRAVQAQTHARLGELIGLDDGSWKCAPGDDGRFRHVEVPLDGWAAFFELLQTRASDAELAHQAAELLGSSVRIRQTEPIPDRPWTPHERKLLQYLEKPRKPDQLERALKRRMVRGFLRTLTLLGKLQVMPATKAIPIPRTVKTHGALSPSSDLPQFTRDIPSNNASNLRDVIRPPAPKLPKKPHPLIEEIKTFHGWMSDKNHFELLGVAENVEAAELRKRHTDLLKKYHPDAWPPEIDKYGEVADLAREISARINEANDCLRDDEKRQDYIILLNDERIRGDMRKAEKIRDAEIKCKMGIVHLNKKEYRRARELFRVAHEYDPSSGLYESYLAWSIYSDPAQDKSTTLDKCYEMLENAIDRAREEPIIHLHLAYVLKAKGRLRDALYHFKQVLRYSPNHMAASSEARYLARRIEQEDNPKKSNWWPFGSTSKKPSKPNGPGRKGPRSGFNGSKPPKKPPKSNGPGHKGPRNGPREPTGPKSSR